MKKKGNPKRKPKRTTDKHHHYFPKRLYKKAGIENKVTTLDYDTHHAFHRYFHNTCKKSHDRPCLLGRCEHQGICCYYRRFENYGEVIV